MGKGTEKQILAYAERTHELIAGYGLIVADIAVCGALDYLDALALAGANGLDNECTDLIEQRQ